MSLKIGISIGDINGIGPEVIIKTLTINHIVKNCTPIIYGSSKVLGYHKNIVNDVNFSFVSCRDADSAEQGKINVINCWRENVNIQLGQATEVSGKCAYTALDRAVNDLVAGRIDALVTAPINKYAMKLASFPYLGHTEYIAEKSNQEDVLMLMISDYLKVALVTTHVPVADITDHLTEDLILEKLDLLNTSLQEDFGIERPVIAVMGLNPHAGDHGKIGTEDEEIVKPALIRAKEEGILAHGPYAADSFFGGRMYQKFDAILAMYHDQGLIPFKSLSFGEGVNFSAGLSVIRTSPDHGTAYDLAGQNQADASSFRKALLAAIDITNNRKELEELTKDSIEILDLEDDKQNN